MNAGLLPNGLKMLKCLQDKPKEHQSVAAEYISLQAVDFTQYAQTMICKFIFHFYRKYLYFKPCLFGRIAKLLGSLSRLGVDLQQ